MIKNFFVEKLKTLTPVLFLDCIQYGKVLVLQKYKNEIFGEQIMVNLFLNNND